MPNERDLKAEIGHVLLVDIVGYSKLLINQQGAVLQTLKQLVQETTAVRDAQDKRSLIRLATGDGMALVFRRDLEAPVECAIQLSAGLRRHPEIPLRMGIHSGPIREILDVNEQVNVTGAGIDVAQRVMDCGDAGHILLSKRTADDLAPYPRWNSLLRDLGETEVKHGVRIHLFSLCTSEAGNPETPLKLQAKAALPSQGHRSFIPALTLVAIILFSLGGTLWWFAHRPAPLAPTPVRSETPAAISEKSIAVLPFENRSEDKENAYFADGIQDEILARLSKIADLKVISRTSTQHYKSVPDNLPEMARQLGVAHIVEGSVQKSGDAVRINVQLIRAANDTNVWSETFDRKLTDVFTVETEVAKAIAARLQAKLTGREERDIGARPTDNLEAYDAYLRALAYTLKPGGVTSPVNALEAQKFLRQAVNLDPKFALAWTLLARVDAGGYVSEALPKTAALREEARQAADTALALEPDLGEPLLAKGYYYYGCFKDYDTATVYFAKAGELLPNSSEVPASLAQIARRRGQWARSESYFDEAERLDPRNAALLQSRAGSYMILRRFSEAQRKLDQVLEITPGDIDTVMDKAGIAQAEGDLPKAAALLATIHPGAENNYALETQIYQAILERRPEQIIPQVKEALEKASPTLGFYVGELRFYLGWAQEMAGDQAGAEKSWRQALSELEPFLHEQPENFTLIGDLALTNAFLGNKTAALTLAERGMEVLPVEKDAMDAGWPIEILARVAARVGEPDRAIAALERLLSMPYEGPVSTSAIPLTPARLRFDPMFDPLRNDPRFQELASAAAKP